MPDTERVEELEVLILHMLTGVWGNPVSREQPIQVACPRPIESELRRRRRKGRHQPRLEVHLQVDDEVEWRAAQPAARIGKGTPPTRPVEEHDLVDSPMAAHKRCRAGLKYPGDPARRGMTFDCDQEGQDVHSVTHGTHHHDGDAVQSGVDDGHRATRRN